MTAEEKRILETFAKVIPTLPEVDKAYLLGFGEGLAAIVSAGK